MHLVGVNGVQVQFRDWFYCIGKLVQTTHRQIYYLPGKISLFRHLIEPVCHLRAALRVSGLILMMLQYREYFIMLRPLPRRIVFAVVSALMRTIFLPLYHTDMIINFVDICHVQNGFVWRVVTSTLSFVVNHIVAYIFEKSWEKS